MTRVSLPRRRLVALGGAAVAATVLLSGCGAVPAYQGGVAASVGGETIGQSEVADLAADYCEAVETRLQPGQALAGSVIATQVAGSLTLRAAAEQFAAEQGVEPDPAYRTEERSLEATIAELSPAQQEAVRRVNLAGPYAAAVQISVGKQVTGERDLQAALTAGQGVFADWLDEHDVQVDPRYGVGVIDGQISIADTSLSFPVSAAAKAAAQGEDSTYAASLPESQRCG